MDGKNLLENAKWTPWSPRADLSPEFSDDGGKLAIRSGAKRETYGKFQSGEISIPERRPILFSASFSCQNVANAEKSVFVMLSFYDAGKKLLERDYADIAEENGAKKFHRIIEAPKGAAHVIVEAGARWCPDSVVEFDDMRLETVALLPQRTVKIATTYKERQGTLEKNFDAVIDIIEKAGKSNPDVILLSELVYESCHEYIPLEKAAQPIPSPLTDAVGECAKKYNTYIILTVNEKEGGAIYNTAVVIGRDGRVCGKYKKIHLPLAEAEMGTSPGDSYRVFDLDFGRVGVIICYDQYFPESSRTLALMGAEIIFLPTQGEDEIVQRAIARTNGVYVAVSGYDGPASSRIIDPLGEIANFVKDKETAYITEQIDLNKRFFVYWMSVGDGNGETKSLFQKERVTQSYGAVSKESHETRI